METYLEQALGALRTRLEGEQAPLVRANIEGRIKALDHILGKVYANELTITVIDRRKFNRSNALFVAHALHRHGHDWFLASEIIESDPLINRDATQAKHWGLIEEAKTHTGHGKTDGYWRITPLGRDFVEGRHRVHSHRLSRAGTLIGFEGDSLTLAQALGEQFDYDEHMAAQRR